MLLTALLKDHFKCYITIHWHGMHWIDHITDWPCTCWQHSGQFRRQKRIEKCKSISTLVEKASKFWLFDFRRRFDDNISTAFLFGVEKALKIIEITAVPDGMHSCASYHFPGQKLLMLLFCSSRDWFVALPQTKEVY